MIKGYYASSSSSIEVKNENTPHQQFFFLPLAHRPLTFHSNLPSKPNSLVQKPDTFSSQLNSCSHKSFAEMIKHTKEASNTVAVEIQYEQNYKTR